MAWVSKAYPCSVFHGFRHTGKLRLPMPLDVTFLTVNKRDNLLYDRGTWVAARYLAAFLAGLARSLAASFLTGLTVALPACFSNGVAAAGAVPAPPSVSNLYNGR